MKREKLVIAKIGGAVIDNHNDLRNFLSAFASLPELKILVHGGGKMATDLAAQLGVKQQMIEGRRVTDADTLRIITMVYAGYINKNVTAQLQSLNCNAIGLSGADGSLVKAHKRVGVKHDYGFAGDVDNVQTDLISLLLSESYVPVVAPVTHDGLGQLLNTNADTIAMEIAAALSDRYDVHLIYCFEKNGVLEHADDENSVIGCITRVSFEQLRSEGSIHSGMLPKLDNAFAALERKTEAVTIGRWSNLQAMCNQHSGTKILKL